MAVTSCVQAGEEEGVQPATGTHDGLELKPAADSDVKRFNKERDVRDIPVGLPFTEMVKRAQNFSVTKLEKDVAEYRETWMQPMQVLHIALSTALFACLTTKVIMTMACMAVNCKLRLFGRLIFVSTDTVVQKIIQLHRYVIASFAVMIVCTTACCTAKLI